MYDWLKQMRFDEITKPQQAALICACQTAERDAYGRPRPDDPTLEERPYSFLLAGDLEDVRKFFRRGGWAMRQAIVYDDLAFVQHTDFGDEWWTYKNASGDPDQPEWSLFENVSFSRMSNEPVEFNRFVRALQMASPESCARLDYTLREGGNPWDFEVAEARDWQGRMVPCRSFHSESDAYAMSVYERPSFEGYVCELSSKQGQCILDIQRGFTSALDAARVVEAEAALCKREGILTLAQFREYEPLASRSSSARLSSMRMNDVNATRGPETDLLRKGNQTIK